MPEMEGPVPETGIGEPVDDEFEALISRLRPFFLESAKAAVVEAIAAVPVPTLKPATVQGVDPVDRTASVLIDGDTVAITAQVLTELPGLADRVMVEFVPPSAVFVVGMISTTGTPAGTLVAYAGPITAHAGAVQTSATPGQPPRGWLWCAGQAVSRTTYSALFNAIGTAYGSGDGAQTFNVPDIRGRIPVGIDNMGGSDASRLSSSNTLGTTGGAETHASVIAHTHSTPSHSHSGSGLSVASHDHSFSATTSTDGDHSHSTDAENLTGSNNVDFGSTSIFANAWDTGSIGNAGDHSHSVSGTSGSASPGVSGSTATDGSGTSGSTGSGSTVNHMPPFISVHMIIKT